MRFAQSRMRAENPVNRNSAGISNPQTTFTIHNKMPLR